MFVATMAVISTVVRVARAAFGSHLKFLEQLVCSVTCEPDGKHNHRSQIMNQRCGETRVSMLSKLPQRKLEGCRQRSLYDSQLILCYVPYNILTAAQEPRCFAGLKSIWLRRNPPLLNQSPMLPDRNAFCSWHTRLSTPSSCSCCGIATAS